MRRHLIHFLLVAILTVCSAATAFAQTTVKGQLVDSETGEPLVGAAVIVEGLSQGSVTDIDGYFKQRPEAEDYPEGHFCRFGRD